MNKLTTKLLLSYLIIIILLVIVGASAISSLSKVNDNGVSMYEDRVKPLNFLAQLARVTENIRAQMLSMRYTENTESIQSVKEYIARIEGIIIEYGATSMPEEEKMKFEEFKKEWSNYVKVVEENLLLAESGQFTDFIQGGTSYELASEDLKELISINETIAYELLTNNQKDYTQTRIILIALILIAITLAIVIGIFMGKNIATPIKIISRRAHEIAGGDLTSEAIQVKNKDEIGGLADSFNEMQVNLQNVVTVVSSSAEELTGVSEEMAASSEEVSASATEVTGAINQVAKNTEIGNQSVIGVSEVLLELSSLIQIAKQKATSALKNSETTYDAANKGKEIVNESIHKMGAIKERTVETEKLIHELDEYSKQIGHITQMITSIAEQTNLLALNASIEAARAGEHGKGFAVVAEEVRQLAEQSNNGANQVAALVRKIANSTKEVVDSIVENKSEVEEGVKVVASAGDALDQILNDVTQTLAKVHDITNVTDEEVASSDRIISLIGELSSIMENNAANTEEVVNSAEETTFAMNTISSSAEEVSAMAQELHAAVNKFKLS